MRLALIPAVLLLLCLCQAATGAEDFGSDSDDYWEEEPATRQAPYKPPPVPEAVKQNVTAQRPFQRRPFSAADYPLELLGLAVLLFYGYNIFSGKVLASWHCRLCDTTHESCACRQQAEQVDSYQLCSRDLL